MQQFESNNFAALTGTADAKPELSHVSRGERFYRLPLCVERLSGAVDRVNVTVRERLLASGGVRDGARLTAEGEVRSFSPFDFSAPLSSQQGRETPKCSQDIT